MRENEIRGPRACHVLERGHSLANVSPADNLGYHLDLVVCITCPEIKYSDTAALYSSGLLSISRLIILYINNIGPPVVYNDTIDKVIFRFSLDAKRNSVTINLS